ncbi:MAG: SDR family NAD(P)-dependent oxidoreductase [Hyphomicrobiaceae bacterium]
MDLGLTGRRCLVTGATEGIGRAAALSLAREGATLVLVARRPEALTAVATAVVAAGGTQPVPLAADLTRAEDRARVARDAEAAVGPIEVLVNNAGGSRPLGPDDSPEVWEEAFALNFHAARELSGHVVPAMRRARWGRIINLSGATAAKTLNASIPAKVALIAWSRSLAAEVAPFGITVNCIAPGRINSEQILKRLHPTEESRAKFIAENIPMGRFGEPEELADLVTFLASPRAAYISGTNIPVDGAMARLAFY